MSSITCPTHLAILAIAHSNAEAAVDFRHDYEDSFSSYHCNAQDTLREQGFDVDEWAMICSFAFERRYNSRMAEFMSTEGTK